MEQALDAHEFETQEVATHRFAGFGIRFLAVIIDAILLFILQIIMQLVFFGKVISFDPKAAMEAQRESLGMYILYNIVAIGIGFLYTTLMIASVKQATLGKMAVGIRVGKENGDKLTFINAVGRYFATFISAIIIGIGYLMVLWDKKKQSLHDKMASTYVFYK
ncbi:MAG: RDD family protein [Bacteroidetes bacterium]|nr:RDD family protein [Bacteroidota bacterium]